MENLAGKSILIAGATGGLGSEIVRKLSQTECSLLLVHRGKDSAYSQLQHHLKDSQASATFSECDFTSASEIDRIIDVFFQSNEQPYALINLLGDPARVDWRTAQIDEFQSSLLKNASAPLYCAKQFGMKLQQSGLPGAIVLFSSMQGVYPFEGSLYYGTAKAALVHGARILAKEFGGAPFVRVNVIAPGVNQAGMAEESIRKGKYQKFLEQNIIPRYGNASDVAKAVLFLLDPDLYMTGQTILYDGGLTLRRDLHP